MIPNISRRNGRSFRGAGRYYLHDKATDKEPKPRTSDRVAWAETRNCYNTDPALAIDEMWKTAFDQDYLKLVAGEPLTGRKTTDPVKTVSLSWAPHQEPAQEDMQQAAASFLEHMGWHEHQAVLIAHDDTPHPHVHIILNRVHPGNGRTLNDWQERKRSQAWAHANEKEHGQVLCHARTGRYDQEAPAIGPDLQPNGMPYPFAALFTETERAFVRADTAHAVQDALEKDMLREQHRVEREQHLTGAAAAFRSIRNDVWQSVRDEFKPAWREHFAEAAALRADVAKEAADLNAAARTAFDSHDTETGLTHWQAMADLHAAAEQQIALAAKALRDEQKQATRERQDEACKVVAGERNERFDAIKAQQAGDRAHLKEWQAMRDETGPSSESSHVEPAINDVSQSPLEDIDLRLTPGEAEANIAELLQNREPVALEAIATTPERQDDAAAFALEEFTSGDGPDLDASINDDRLPDLVADLSDDRGTAFELPSVPGEPEQAGGRDLTDAGAGVIGAVADGIANIISELISPPTPEEQAKAKRVAIKEEEQRPAREEAAFQAELVKLAKQSAATLAHEQEDEKKRSERYWEGRERERDRGR